MLSGALKEMQADPARWERCQGFFKVKTIPARTCLLREGEVARFMYFVKEGSLRLWFNKEGKDITFQFFMEGQAVSSIESFLSGEPSMCTLESIEAATVVAISRSDWDRLHAIYPQMRERFMQMILKRMEDYARLFLSRIKDSPAERYQALVQERPDMIRRIPQHFIASYLGITPVSLSRIRGRLHKKR